MKRHAQSNNGAHSLLYLGLLIYAGVVYHRDRKARRTGGAYAPTTNPVNNNLSAQEYGQATYAGSYGNGPTYGQAPTYTYNEAYAPRAEELKPIPMPRQQQQHHQTTEYFSPSSVGATPVSPQSAGGYVMPPPHPSVSPAPTSPLPASHPSTGQGPYVLPPPMKGGAHEMPGRH